MHQPGICPEADTNFQEYYVNDECDYTHPTLGVKNWAYDWLGAHQGEELEQISQQCSSCAHSVSLNCVKKGIACWYLWARIAGWDGVNTGINQSLLENDIKIYPNPETDKIFIETIKNINSIEIIDINGKVQTIPNSKSISTNNFEKGIYLIRVEMIDSNTFQRKIIIQ